jgi:DNA-binding NtrC family response regulator
MSGISVLLVDDEPAFVDVLTKRLSRRMLEVSSASSGREALAVLAERPVDVVLLDLKMPEWDGLTVLSRIKQTWPLVEVILLTGHADLTDAIAGLRRGAFDYVLKPVDTETLTQKVEDAWERKRVQEDKINVWRHRSAGGDQGAAGAADQSGGRS